MGGMIDKEAEAIWQRIADSLERTAVANEQIVKLATDERDAGDNIFGPPFCPHCGMLNPTCRSEGGEGEMAEFVLVAHCHNCGNILYAVPQGWLVFTNAESAKAQIEGRTE